MAIIDAIDGGATNRGKVLITWELIARLRRLSPSEVPHRKGRYITGEAITPFTDCGVTKT